MDGRSRGSGAFGRVRAFCGDGEIDEMHDAEFAVDLARRLDVVGDVEGDNSRGDLARRVDEAVAVAAGPIDLDHHIRSARGDIAPGQTILARAVGGAPQNAVIGRARREFRHNEFKGGMRALDIDPLRAGRDFDGGDARRWLEKGRRRDGKDRQRPHIGENAHDGGADVARHRIRDRLQGPSDSRCLCGVSRLEALPLRFPWCAAGGEFSAES
jgi:hypothetical protein